MFVWSKGNKMTHTKHLYVVVLTKDNRIDGTLIEFGAVEYLNDQPTGNSVYHTYDAKRLSIAERRSERQTLKVALEKLNQLASSAVIYTYRGKIDMVAINRSCVSYALPQLSQTLLAYGDEIYTLARRRYPYRACAIDEVAGLLGLCAEGFNQLDALAQANILAQIAMQLLAIPRAWIEDWGKFEQIEIHLLEHLRTQYQIQGKVLFHQDEPPEATAAKQAHAPSYSCNWAQMDEEFMRQHGQWFASFSNTRAIELLDTRMQYATDAQKSLAMGGIIFFDELGVRVEWLG
jgi:hypothetical protein